VVLQAPSATSDKTQGPEPSNRNLVLFAGGIFCCYFYYGIIQEKITKGKYTNGEEEEKFHYTLCLAFVQCIINAVFAKIIMVCFPKERDVTHKGLYAACAFTYLGAMAASTSALQYIPYPTQVLGKSCKPIPVMILGVLLAGKRYPHIKYFCVLLIVAGVAMFMYKDKPGSQTTGHTLGIGEFLLLVSLTCDGLTGACQDYMRQHYKPGTFSMMLFMNLFSVLYLSFGVVLTGELFTFLAFANRNPFVLVNMIIFSLMSALGQMFIFLTVTTFGPLTCSIVTTTRKLFTILASVIFFQNPLSLRQWTGTGTVFLGLGLDSVYGKAQKKGADHPGKGKS